MIHDSSIHAGRIRAALRGSLVAGAVAVSLLAGAGGAAAITVTGPVEGLDVAAVEQCGTVDLTVKLPLGNPYDQLIAGQLPPGPVAGTVFTAERIEGIDLTTPAGWREAAGISVVAAGKAPSALTKTAVTDATGTAVFGGMSIGLYLVTAVTPEDPAYAKTTFAPMLVTLPTGGVGAGGSTGTWNCTPVVYAKPTTETPTTPPTTPTTPTTPTKPAPTKPVPPTEPPGAPKPPAPTPGSPGGRLPLTGVSVLGILGAAMAAVGAGLLFTRIGKKGQSRHDHS